ncbi:helix-turn-helix domain-containing protein [Sphingomonas sp. ID0503]|uniref:helix-turn-helix domain-containing protein n=1 Tax=Sphingomonas sp. ID0503 TaxID=3399691 RepID=UPI003AFB4962
MGDFDLDYDEAQAARILGVALVTLRRWRKAGYVGHHRTPGGRIRYSLDQLANFKSRCRVGPMITQDHV